MASQRREESTPCLRIRTRTPFSLLRASAPVRDEAARERARALLEAHVAGDGPRRARGCCDAGRLPSRWVGRRSPRRSSWPARERRLPRVLLRTEHTGHLPVFTPQGALSSQFHVGSRGVGYCWTASLATGGESDAYRCMAGERDPRSLLRVDPVNHATVACFIDPWHPVTMLRLDRPLPRHEPVVVEPTAVGDRHDRRAPLRVPDGRDGADGRRADQLRLRRSGSYLIGVPDRSGSAVDDPQRAEVPSRRARPSDAAAGDFPLAQIKETVP